jgi:hypothetical protein
VRATEGLVAEDSEGGVKSVDVLLDRAYSSTVTLVDVEVLPPRHAPALDVSGNASHTLDRTDPDDPRATRPSRAGSALPAGDSGGDRVGGVLVHLFGDALVGVAGQGGGGVAELFGDNFDIDACVEGDGGGGDRRSCRRTGGMPAFFARSRNRALNALECQGCPSGRTKNRPVSGHVSPVASRQANLFFQLVSSRYERASMIVTSNKVFGRWGEVFGDDVVAAAMIDRLVHRADVVALKGDSYRLKDRDLGRVPAATTTKE